LSRRKSPNKLRKGKERKDMTRKKNTFNLLSESESSGSLEARLSWVYVKNQNCLKAWLDMKAKMNRNTIPVIA
jgi:hypothetical protein